MKEIIDLVRRFVVAIETIAACMKNPPMEVRNVEFFDTEGNKIPLDKKIEDKATPEEEVRYEELTRKELIKLCKKAGFEVKKGTKTTTLIRWLNRAENLPEDEDKTDDLETETGFDPLTEKEPEDDDDLEDSEEDDLEEDDDDLEEDDPLGAEEEDEEEDEEEEITKEILHKALTKAIEKGGNSIVAKLLKTKSKDVANFKQLPEGDYPAVFKATMKYLESK